MTRLAASVSSLRWCARVAVLFSVGFSVAACGNDPVKPNPNALEALPVTSATVTAAVELATQSPMVVPPNCAAALLINCSSGTAGTPVSLAITRGPITVTPVSASEFSFATDLAVTSLQNIPVSYGGVSCNAVVNTAPGASTTVHFAGTATFSKWAESDAVNAMHVVGDVSGLESADVTLVGSSVCAAASSMQSLVIGNLSDALAGDVWVCGAVGPAASAHVRQQACENGIRL